MEFTIRHRLDALVAMHDALIAERLRRPRIVFWILAIGAATALLLWPLVAWLSAIVLGASAMAIAMFNLVRDSARKRVRRQFELLHLEEARYRVDENGLHETSTIGGGWLRWHVFETPRELEGFLLIPRRPADSGQLIALPLEQLPADVRQAIEDRIARASGTRMG